MRMGLSHDDIFALMMICLVLFRFGHPTLSQEDKCWWIFAYLLFSLSCFPGSFFLLSFASAHRALLLRASER